MKTENAQFHKKQGNYAHQSPMQYQLHCNALPVMVPGFLKRKRFVVCAEVIHTPQS
jgi:hypothetical protein